MKKDYKFVRFLKSLAFPFKTIGENGWQFTLWILFILVFGLLGFWLPLFDNLFKTICSRIPFNDIIFSGSITTFSIVILVEGLGNIISIKPKTNSKLTIGVKSITYGLTIIIFTLNVYLLGKVTSINLVDNTNLLRNVIIIATILSILLAIYLYCFRKTDWEEFADDYLNRQNEEIEDATDDSNNDNPLP